MLTACRYLQKGLGMRESDGPVVACITRLVPQKVCLLGGGCCNSGSWLYESACRNTFPPDCTVVPAALQAGVYVHELRELKRRAYTSYSMQWVGQWSRGGSLCCWEQDTLRGTSGEARCALPIAGASISAIISCIIIKWGNEGTTAVYVHVVPTHLLHMQICPDEQALYQKLDLCLCMQFISSS